VNSSGSRCGSWLRTPTGVARGRSPVGQGGGAGQKSCPPTTRPGPSTGVLGQVMLVTPQIRAGPLKTFGKGRGRVMPDGASV